MKLVVALSSMLGWACWCPAQVIPSSGSSSGPTSVIIGQVQTATGGAISNGSMTFSLSQPAVVSGSATIATQQTSCYTSAQGNIVGLPDPVVAPVVATNTSTGTLPAATYFLKIYYIGAGGVSALSPETSITLVGQGTLLINPPALQPAAGTGFGVAISSTSGTETIQGTVAGWSQFGQAVVLSAGGSPATINTSFCSLYFSDQLIPTGTYYSVNLTNKNGSQIAGFPQTWCTYGGAGATINVSNGAPTGNCNTNGVFYPTPLFANPPSGSQSMSGNFNLNGNMGVSGNISGGTFTNQTFQNPTFQNPSFQNGVGSDGSGFKHKRFAMTCATSTTQFSSCPQAITWTTPFADTNYTPTCFLDSPNTAGTIAWSAFKTANGLTLVFLNLSSGSALSVGTADCTAVHD